MAVELKTFDKKEFGLDLYRHRNGIKMSRAQYAKSLKMRYDQFYVIERLEDNKIKYLDISIAFNICERMGKNINDYFK